MQEYKKFRIETKRDEILKSGFLISLIGVPLVLIFTLLDRSAVNLGNVLHWRLVGMFPMLLFVIMKSLWSRYLERLNPLIVQWFGFIIIFALSCMMSAIFMEVISNSASYTAVGLAGTTSGSILVIFGCGLFNGVGFKKAVTAAGVPYIIMVILLVIENRLSSEERVLTANIISALILYCVMVWRREKTDDERLYNLFMLDHEHSMLESAVKERTLELEILLSELHHNVRNNLQTILSIVCIYEHSYHFNDIHTRIDIIKKAVQILSLSHSLSHFSKTSEKVSLKKFINGLLSEIFDERDVIVNKEIAEYEIKVENAVKLGLILLHILSQTEKECSVKIAASDNILEISITSDGKSPEYKGENKAGDPLFDIIKADAVEWSENELNYTRLTVIE